MVLSFDTAGNDKQKLAASYWCDDVTDEIVYGGAKGGGKSYLGCSLIFGDALMYPGTHTFIARKHLNDLRKFTIPSIHEVFDSWGLSQNHYRYDGKDSFFQMHNGSKVFLIDAKYLPSDPLYQRYGSMQMTRGWIEEAGEFEKSAKTNLNITVGRWLNDKYKLKGKLLQTCNPNKGYLYKDVYKPSKEGTLIDRIKFVTALPQDNKRLAAGYIERLHDNLAGTEKQRLLFGDWEYDNTDDDLCDYEQILAVFTNSHIPRGETYLTADVARMGSDKAIIAVWRGWEVVEFVTYDKSKITELQDAINHLRTKYQMPANRCIADEDGVGGGLVDNCGIKGFVNNSTAKNGENYTNLQSQCCFKLAQKIREGQIYISAELSEKHREEIIEELEQLKSYKSDGGKLRIKPKEQIKQDIGRSPDWRDALMMRISFDLTTPWVISI